MLSDSDGVLNFFAEGIHRFAAKSVGKNRWRWMKLEKRTGNLVDLLENRMPRKLYGRARLPWPEESNHILLVLA